METYTHNMSDYAQTRDSFRWEVPDYYNFALDDFDKWAGDKTKTALITVSTDGKSASRLSFWSSASSRQNSHML
jgi:hypothetical protein